jgi:hypothetical protein
MYTTDVQHPQSQMSYYRQSIGVDGAGADGQVDDKQRGLSLHYKVKGGVGN